MVPLGDLDPFPWLQEKNKISNFMNVTFALFFDCLVIDVLVCIFGADYLIL